MMNYTFTHIENELEAPITVSEELDCIITKLGEATTSMTAEQAEKLFDELDKQLHEETYSQLQDKIFSLEADLEEANNLIEQYRGE